MRFQKTSFSSKLDGRFFFVFLRNRIFRADPAVALDFTNIFGIHNSTFSNDKKIRKANSLGITLKKYGGGARSLLFQVAKKTKNKKCQFFGDHLGFSYFHFLQTGKKQVGWGSMHRSPSPYRSGRAQGASVWRRIRIIKSRVKSQFVIW